MDRNPRTSSSGRRRNVVKPGRIDTILGHDRQGLRLNFGLAMHQHRSYTSASSSRAPVHGGSIGGGHRGGSARDAAGAGADSSEPLTLSGSLSQEPYSHGMFPSQGMSLSQGTTSQMGHQSQQSETGGYGMSQPSPDLLAPYVSARHGHTGSGAGRATPTSKGAEVDATGGQERQVIESLQGAKSGNSAHHQNHHHSQSRRKAHGSNFSSSTTSSAKARRPQPLPRNGAREKGHAPRVSHSRSGKGVDVEGAVGTTAAVQAFDRLLSEQFRNQVMSELSELRTLVETTREIVSDQTKGLDQGSTATNELREELQGTHSLAKAASGSASKALNVLETTIPAAFLSLESRLSRVEETVAAAAETAAATVASAKDAAAAATAAASAASALARRYDESMVGIDCRERRPVADSVSDGLIRKGDRSPITNNGRLSPAPQQQYHLQHEGQHHQHQQQQEKHQQQQHQQRWRQEEEQQQQGKHQQQRQEQRHQRHQRQEQRQETPPPEFLLGGIMSGSTQESCTRGGRKRKSEDQQLEHQEPPSRRVLQQDGSNRVTKELPDIPQALQSVNHDTQDGESSWQGADESLRWTQPWGGEAGPATAAAAGASSRVRQSPRHDPEIPRGVLEQRNPCHGGSGGEREELSSPSAGCASSSFASSALPHNNRDSERVVDDAEVDMPSSSLPLCEADSFNPFQDADLVPITTGSIGAKAPGNVSTTRRQGSRSPPAPNTFPAVQSARMRSGLGVRPATRDSSGKSPIADATAAAPTVSSSYSTLRRPTSSTAGTRGGAVAGEPSFSGSRTRMVTRRAKAGLGQGDFGAGRIQASGAGDAPVVHMVQSRKPPPPRSSPSGSSAPPAAASANPFSRGPSVDRSDPASSVGGRHRISTLTAAQSKANRELSHDVSVRTNRRNVSGLDQAQAGLSRSDGRTPHEESGQRKPTSTDVGVIEDEVEDYEDSFGGPGLTVEAYMAEKHNAKRSPKRGTPKDKKAARSRKGEEETPTPETNRPSARKKPPPHNRGSSRRGSLAAPTSAVRDSNAGGGGNHKSNSDSWIVGGGGGW
ncbi:unnamed protein product [Ectocarpus sp. 4 AP-2014]